MSWRMAMVNDEVDIQMALDTRLVPIEQVFRRDTTTSASSTRDERVRNARYLLPRADTKETSPATQRPPTIACEDVPLDEARRMSRGPRMDPKLYHALKQNIQSLDKPGTRPQLREGANPTTREK